MSHYFHTPLNDESKPQKYEFEFAHQSLKVTTDIGVFSHGDLDKGTAHLLHYLETHIDEITHTLPDGDLLDLGCGAGPIALAMATAFPSRRVWAVDVNERALSLCAKNANDNALSNIVTALPDDDRLPTTFAMLWSNPPIRIGKAELHDLLMHWLPHLCTTGSAYLVVSKNLGGDSLQTWLTTKTFETQRVGSKSGFRILHVAATMH